MLNPNITKSNTVTIAIIIAFISGSFKNSIIFISYLLFRLEIASAIVSNIGSRLFLP